MSKGKEIKHRLYHAGLNVADILNASIYSRSTIFWIDAGLKEEKDVKWKSHRQRSIKIQILCFLAGLKCSITSNIINQLATLA